MKLANVLYKLFVDPWCITPAAHRNLCEIVRDHVDGAAHIKGGRADAFINGEDDEDAEPMCAIAGGIAVISVHGVIGRRVGSMEKSSGVCDLLDLERTLRECMNNAEVSGVLLSFDSPGGTVAGVPETAALIAECSRVKPFVAYADDLMASAAYWLAAPCRLIVANKSSQVGSIGVYQSFLDSSRAYEMEGYKQLLFATGKFKGMGISGLPLSAEQQAMLQSRVDQVFGWFTAAIKAGRGNVPDEAMQGQTYYGEDAMAVNLVDRIGTKQDAMDELNALIESTTKG
jgi:signal peptide peptidase SppA